MKLLWFSHVSMLFIVIYHGITKGLFELHIIISFPFLRAKDVRTFLLIMRTRSFFTLLYVGGTYAQGRGGGHRPPPYVGGTYAQGRGGGQSSPPYILTPRQFSKGQGFSNQIFSTGPASL